MPRQSTEYFREYRRKNRKKLNAARRVWKAKIPKRYASQTQKWDSENAAKRRAYTRLNYALKKGEIRKVPCVCGNPDVIAYYNDYSDLSTVEWLCRYCHSKRRGVTK